MDDLDRRLLAALPGATRPGVLELSRRLGIARGTVQARLDRLQAAGVLAGFGPYLDLRALGFTVLAFTTLEIAQGQEAAVIESLATIPEVIEVHKTTVPVTCCAGSSPARTSTSTTCWSGCWRLQASPARPPRWR